MSELSDAHKTIIGEMLENFRRASEAERYWRALAERDLKFEAAFDEGGKSTQWDEDALKNRTDAPIKRLALTFPQLGQFCSQVTNEFRQMLPAIQVNPVDSDADPLTAEVLQGIIRSIEQNSRARVAYETGFESAVKCGFGAWRVITKYTYDDPQTEQEFRAQHIEIRPIKDRFTVFGDPAGLEPDGSDWEFCFVADYLAEEVYRRRYPKSELTLEGNWGNIATTLPPDWMGANAALVVEYFYTKHKEEKVVLLSNGTVARQAILDANVAKFGNSGLAPGVTVVGDRILDKKTRHWVKSNGVEILSETDWPGKYIPVVPVYGSELTISGKTLRSGLVRPSISAQQALNYIATAIVEIIGLMPKSPYFALAGSVEKYKAIYERLNDMAFATVPYDPVELPNGQYSVQAPQRINYEPAVGQLMGMAGMFQNFLKASTGMYGSSLGEPSGEKSGLAIQSRQAQGDKATFHFQSNAERSIWHTGRIYLDLITRAKTYDDLTILQIIGKDEKRSAIIVDSSIPPEEKEQAAQEGRFNLNVGRYDVTISVGQTYATQRQETVAKLSEILKTWPNVMPPQAMQVLVLGLLRAIDIPGGKEMADSVEQALGGLKEGQAIPPQVQQQMQAMGQQMQMMAKQLQDAKSRETARTAELESAERIAAMRNQLELEKLKLEAAIKEAELRSKEAIEQWKMEAAATQQSIEDLRAGNAASTSEAAPPDAGPPPSGEMGLSA